MQAKKLLPINDDDVLIGRRVRMARLEIGYTQTDLAHAFGVSPQQIQKFETGLNRVSAKMLYRLSQICDKPMSWFMQDLGLGAPETTDLPRRSNVAAKVIRYLSKVEDPRLQNKILGFVKTMAED